jgi:cytoskeleton protein RodZ
MTKGSFGENLKREREMRGVSLEEISAATRIATRFLKAIENEQWEQLPGGVFNRGFVRAVAHYLGLDEESTVAEYALAVNDRPSVPVWTGRPPAVAPDRPWLGWVLAAVIVAALIAGSWFVIKQILAWRAARHAVRSTAMIAAAPPAILKLPAVSKPAAASNETALDPAPGYVPVPPAAPDSADPALLVLKVETGKKTRVTIRADAVQIFNGTLKAGENRVFSAKDRFDVSARDAGSLLLELNGKTLAPIGPPGKAGNVTVTRETLKQAAGDAN